METRVDKLLTVGEVARRLNVCVKTVRRMIARGDLRAVRIGSRVRIPPDALSELLDARAA